MTEFGVLLAITLLPAAGTLCGALIAELFDPPDWLLGAALHTAAGLALGVAILELAPRALEPAPPALFVMAFLAGAGLSIGLAHIGTSISRRSVGGAHSGAIMVYVAIGADLLGDGVMTGVGSSSAADLGLLLASSQIVGNLPAGFAANANLRDHGVHRRYRLLLAASAAAPVFLGATGAYFVLQDASAAVHAVALAAVLGLLVCATVEDLIPEADKPHAPRGISTTAFALGFTMLFIFSQLLLG